MTPGATYRLQLHAGFTFDDAAEVAPYLRDLGVTHVYASPSLASAPGSTHGYDVVDPTRLDAERGGEEGFARLRAALDEAGLGLVLDIVPNHLGLALPENRWWWDTMRQGPDSPWAEHFDIAWEQGPTGRPRLVWPELGRSLVDALAAGELGADVASGTDVAIGTGGEEGDAGELVVTYFDNRYPTRPGTAADHGLPDDPARAAAALRDDPGLLAEVLDDQHYRLVDWRRANQELVHRRFFDITTLGGLRVEDRSVFDDVHSRVLALVDDGAVDGLRVDHPDGLWDPAGYARALRAAAPQAWIVFEKILEADEALRADWPVDGTVGYAFCNLVLGLFLDGGSEPALTALYDRLTGARQDPVAITEAAKREAVGLFDTELVRLADLLTAVAEEVGAVPDGPDAATDPASGEAAGDVVATGVARASARRVLEELVVAFGVYRTYVVPARDEVAAADHEVLDRAVARARAHLTVGPHVVLPGDGEPAPPDAALLDLLDRVLRLQHRGPGTEELVHRLQQLTGPVMAKGIEDTTFYRWVRFVAANEVGGHPTHLGTTLDAFHAANTARATAWPSTMLTTSTHDTKRAEDVRARLAVLTEVPDTWVRAVQRLHDAAAPHRGAHGPTPAHEYLLWQTLVGAWPIGAERLVAYMTKAAREGKQATSWLAIDEAYEADLERFARGVLDDADVMAVVEDLLDGIVEAGRLTSLSQALLRLTSPGVPDTYQGTELWDLSLVDPDNRRPVDHALRARLLAELDGDDGPRPAAVLARMDEGLPKLLVVSRALRARLQRPASFGPAGAYTPVRARGARADHVTAFLRGSDVAVLAPRLVAGLGGAFRQWRWDDTELDLPAGRWRDVMTGTVREGGTAAVARLLDALPVALLLREEAP